MIDVKVLTGHMVTYSGSVRRYLNFGKVFLGFLSRFENEINVDADLAIFGCSDQALTWPQNQQLSLMFGMVLAQKSDFDGVEIYVASKLF